MVDSSVTVGLSVGIPSALILGTCLLLWLRNQRKQEKEDLLDRDIDLELKDDVSYTNMQDVILQPKGGAIGAPLGPSIDSKSPAPPSFQGSPDKQYVDSSHSSSSMTEQPSTPRHHLSREPITSVPGPLHHRTPSSYDFYDSVIPVLPTPPMAPDHQQLTVPPSPSGAGSITPLAPPPALGDNHTQSSPSKTNSVASLNNITNYDSSSRSLDNLAKQLTQPTFFEKLPSRAGAPGTVRRRDEGPRVNNNNTTNPHTGPNSLHTSLDQSRDDLGSGSVHIGKVLAGKFDNSFSGKPGSPFTDEEQGDVLFK